MPYVDKESRQRYNHLTTAIDALPKIESKGDLEFLVFKLMKKFMVDRESRYSVLHDCVYAVQHCSDEFRRRYLDKREDKALETNGDI